MFIENASVILGWVAYVLMLVSIVCANDASNRNLPLNSERWAKVFALCLLFLGLLIVFMGDGGYWDSEKAKKGFGSLEAFSLITVWVIALACGSCYLSREKWKANRLGEYEALLEQTAKTLRHVSRMVENLPDEFRKEVDRLSESEENLRLGVK